MDKSTIKILICDDSILARKSLRNILTEEGFGNILEVANGRDAVDLCKKEQPQIAILDIIMPVLDGVSATREINNISPSTSVIIVSSGGDKSFITEAIKAGAVDFLLKPVEANHLMEIINNNI